MTLVEKFMTWKRSIPWLQSRVPEKFILPLFSVCLGYKKKSDGKWGGNVAFGKDKTMSLFYNGMFYVRVMLPFFVGLQIRWAGKDINAQEYLQTYLGIKLNGEWAVIPRFRIQSDVSAGNGTTGPNYGQATGWNEGTK